MNTTRRLPGPSRPALTGSLVALVLAATLTACGSDGGDETASDPAGSTGSPSPSESETVEPDPTSTPAEPEDGAPTTIPATGSAGVSEVTVVSATEGGGSPSSLAFALDTELAVDDFVAGMQAGLADDVTATVAEVAQQSPDATPYGAVASTGCEPPRSVAITAGEAGFEVVPKLPKSTVQCLAPVTYVVVFAAPNA